MIVISELFGLKFFLPVENAFFFFKKKLCLSLVRLSVKLLLNVFFLERNHVLIFSLL